MGRELPDRNVEREFLVGRELPSEWSFLLLFEKERKFLEGREISIASVDGKLPSGKTAFQ